MIIGAWYNFSSQGCILKQMHMHIISPAFPSSSCGTVYLVSIANTPLQYASPFLMAVCTDLHWFDDKVHRLVGFEPVTSWFNMRPRLYYWAIAPLWLRSAMLAWQKVYDNQTKMQTYHVGRLANLWRLSFDHVFWRNGSWLCCIMLEVFLCFQNWSWRCLWWGRSCLKAWLLASISRRLKNKRNQQHGI